MDRVADDHPSVRTVDATLRTWGPTDRPEVRLPAAEADALPADEVVRLVLDGAEYRCVPAARDGTAVVRGAYDTADAARDPGGEPNRLADWVDAAGLGPGRTVHLDVVEPDFRYGLRAPGERAVYDDTGSPTDSLAAIAERVSRDEGHK